MRNTEATNKVKNGASKLEWIKTQIENGKTVYFATHLKITKITKKHVSMINVDKSGSIYINKICYDYAKLSAE